MGSGMTPWCHKSGIGFAYHGIDPGLPIKSTPASAVPAWPIWLSLSLSGLYSTPGVLIENKVWLWVQVCTWLILNVLPVPWRYCLRSGEFCSWGASHKLKLGCKWTDYSDSSCSSSLLMSSSCDFWIKSLRNIGTRLKLVWVVHTQWVKMLVITRGQSFRLVIFSRQVKASSFSPWTNLIEPPACMGAKPTCSDTVNTKFWILFLFSTRLWGMGKRRGSWHL